MFRKAIVVVTVLMAVGLATPAATQDRHGSIVFSQEAGGGYAWGMAWSYSSNWEATDTAMRECRSRGGSSCVEVGWFRNACGSLAIGDNNGYGTGWGETMSQAADYAMGSCRSVNRNCRIEITRCAN